MGMRAADEPIESDAPAPGHEPAPPSTPEPGAPPEHDWSTSAARWPIVIVLATATVVGLFWVGRTRLPPPPAPVIAASEPVPRTSASPSPAIPQRTPPRERPAADAPSDTATPAPIVRTPEPTPARQTPSIARRIDLNTAPAAELELLPGIGPALAARIIEERENEGPFESVDDLQRVRGIGPRTVERIREHAAVSR